METILLERQLKKKKSQAGLLCLTEKSEQRDLGERLMGLAGGELLLPVAIAS